MCRSARKRGQLELELEGGNQRYVRIKCGLSVDQFNIMEEIFSVKYKTNYPSIADGEHYNLDKTTNTII
jgi:hypothetical protein